MGKALAKLDPQTALPVSYTNAVKALTECRDLDEAKEFDDASEALAAWARIYNDDQVGRQAKQLRLHAHRRMGQLAREIAPVKPKKGGGRTGGPVAKLKEHGLTRHKAEASNHLGKMSDPEFQILVDADDPPAPTTVTRRFPKPLELAGLPQAEAERLAKRHNLPVDEILIRYVEGMRGDELVESGFVAKTDEWMSTQEVADYLATSYGTLCSLSVGGACPIERKPWGKKATSMRGCGALWRRSDVELVKRMRRELCGTLAITFRVLKNAKNRGWRIEPPVPERQERK